MSKRKKGNKSQKKPQVNTSEYEFTRIDYLAVLPAVFMCFLIIFVLFMDLVITGMASEQYQDFPSMFRITHGAIVCAGFVFWIIYLSQKGLGYLKPTNWLNKKHIYVLFFVIFLLLAAISTIINGFDEKVIHGVSARNIGIFHIFAFFLIYCFLSAKINRHSLRSGVIVLYLITADLVGLAALFDHFISPISAFGAKKELSTIFFNGNHYGYFLCMATLAAAGLFLFKADITFRAMGLLSMLLNGLVLALNNSFGCILAVAITLVLFFIVSLFANRTALKSFILLFIFAFVLGLVGSFTASGVTSGFLSLIEDIREIAINGDDAAAAGHNRWLLWTQTVDYIIQRPLFGYGCEGISDMIMADTGRGNPHNELLTYAAYFGIPAAVAYTLGMIVVFARFFHSNVLSDPVNASAGMAATGYFFSSLFGVPMFYTAPFFFIFLGLSLSGSRQ